MQSQQKLCLFKLCWLDIFHFFYCAFSFTKSDLALKSHGVTAFVHLDSFAPLDLIKSLSFLDFSLFWGWDLWKTWLFLLKKKQNTFFCLVGIYGILILSIENTSLRAVWKHFWKLDSKIDLHIWFHQWFSVNHCVFCHSWAKGIDLAQLTNSAFTYNLSLSDLNNTCMFFDCAGGKKHSPWGNLC